MYSARRVIRFFFICIFWYFFNPHARACSSLGPIVKNGNIPFGMRAELVIFPFFCSFCSFHTRCPFTWPWNNANYKNFTKLCGRRRAITDRGGTLSLLVTVFIHNTQNAFIRFRIPSQILVFINNEYPFEKF